MRAFLAVLAVALTATPVQAHFSPTSRVHNMRHVAEQVYGPDLCDVGTMSIPIMRTPNLTWTESLAGGGTRTRRVSGLFTRKQGELPYTGCRIEINDQPWDTGALCRLLGHEFGHAAGRDHVAPGRVWNVMAPRVISYGAPCERAVLR